ncbi:MAG: hypothetical protein ACRD2C_05890 [Acidimicrobiales bacterium]
MRSVLGTLHGLNRVLLANPLMKWEQATVARFPLAPRDLGERLGEPWMGDLAARVLAVEALLKETVDLAEREIGTSFDETRRVLGRRRQAIPEPAGEDDDTANATPCAPASHPRDRGHRLDLC